MEDKWLKRYLKSVGMGCFIRYFNQFNDPDLSNSEIADIIYEEMDYTYKACNSRVGHARMIIRAGKAQDAFEMIANANRVDPEIAARAKVLLEISSNK
jgi:hypothetical protein